MSRGLPPKARSPQEKKALSLKKDRRNDYGQADKAARKLIPLRKAQSKRAGRRTAKVELESAAGAEEAKADVAESSLVHDVAGRSRWRKSPDAPLGEVLAKQAERRVADVGAKARRAERQAAYKEKS